MPFDTYGRWSGATAFPIANPTVDDGHGHTFVDSRGLFVLHAILLHTGKILCFSGHVEVSMYAPLCYLFDPKDPGAVMSPIAFPAGADLFCCHYVQIPDGRILAMGGSQHDHGSGAGTVYRGSTGSKTVGIFDPDTGVPSWTLSRSGAAINELVQGRWYPTAVTLPDGRVAVFSGRRELDDAGSPPPGVPAPYIADAVEILSPPDWSSQILAGGTKPLPIYPGMHLAPDGKIYFTHTCWGQEIADPDTAAIEIGTNSTSGTWTVFAGKNPPHRFREEGMSVLLPPAQDGKILVVGGGQAQDVNDHPVLDPAFPHPGGGGPNSFDHVRDPADPLAADVLDTATQNWTSVGPMSFGRTNGHCVLLPDATVLICGGHDNYKWQDSAAASYPGLAPTHPSLIAEIFTPGGGFTTVPPADRGNPGTQMQDPRMYHSVALLLPDGRVFTAGGADPNHHEPTVTYPGTWDGRTYGPGMALNSKTFEFYQPPYFFKGPRPTITDVKRNGAMTRRVEYGQQLTIETGQAGTIEKVVIMRPNAVTHHTDSDQRYVSLAFTPAASHVTATMVNDPKLAPPGYYMLWIVDTTKRPCEEAVFIQLMPRGSTCFVASAVLGFHDPLLPELQRLREGIRQASASGRLFMAAVTGIYESFSPKLARRLARDPSLRGAVRDWVVRPVAGVIRATEALTRPIPWPRLRQGLLIACLGIEGLVGTVLLPAVAGAVLARAAADRWRAGRASDARKE
jgi:hypothetical protein